MTGSPADGESGGPATGSVRGRDFRLLLATVATSNLGDGLLRSAGPLLVATLTRRPSLVALALTVQLLPTFLFSLPVGALVDRLDRRRVVAAGNLARAVVAGGVAAALAADLLTLPLLYLALFLLGTAEVGVDTGAQTLVVSVVDDEDLGAAASRIVGARIVTNELAGPPLGALLFGLGLAVPYAANALLMLAAALLVTRVAIRPPVDQDVPTGPLRVQIREGWRFVVASPAIRRLAILVAAFNVTFGMYLGIQVLWALERLGLDESGFGLLLTSTAVGGMVGSVAFARLERRFGYATLLRAGLVIETATHLLLAATTSPWLAGVVLTAFGAHAAVWGSLAGTIRARAVPDRLLGRVNGVYRLAVFAPLVVGTSLGGVVADAIGLGATLVVSGLGAGATLLWAWRSMEDLGTAGSATASAEADG